MIKIEYSERFLKDLKSLKNYNVYDQIKKLCFDELPSCSDLKSVKNLKKMVSFKNYFRIKVGNYRIGLKVEKNVVTILRVLHRNEIYKYFP